MKAGRGLPDTACLRVTKANQTRCNHFTVYHDGGYPGQPRPDPSNKICRWLIDLTKRNSGNLVFSICHVTISTLHRPALDINVVSPHKEGLHQDSRTISIFFFFFSFFSAFPPPSLQPYNHGHIPVPSSFPP